MVPWARARSHGPGPGAQGPSELIKKGPYTLFVDSYTTFLMLFLRKCKYLENLFDAVIRTVLKRIKGEILENMFDAVIITMLITMF